MKSIPLKEILTRIRPLPWPVNSNPANEGAMTQEQLEATRIYRRHAANVLPELIDSIEALILSLKYKDSPSINRNTNRLLDALENANEIKTEP